MRETVKVLVMVPLVLVAFVGSMYWLVRDSEYARVQAWILLVVLADLVWAPFVFRPWAVARWGRRRSTDTGSGGA